jgi:hypothetical protein
MSAPAQFPSPFRHPHPLLAIHSLSHISSPTAVEKAAVFCSVLHFFAFFCTPQKLIFRLFKQFQPLAAKHLGVGYPEPVASSVRHHASASGFPSLSPFFSHLLQTPQFISRLFTSFRKTPRGWGMLARLNPSTPRGAF